MCNFFKRYCLAVILVLFSNCIFATDIFGVYPTHWFTGMKNPKIQLMIHGDNIGAYSSVKTTYPGIIVNKVGKAENKNYLFVDVTISSTAKPGKFKFTLSGGGQANEDINYELKSRSTQNGKTRVVGVHASDFVYLVLPDRFANGDPSNDAFNDMRDQVVDRNNPFSRHGGDIQGITNHLDYFQELGATTLWLMPVVENDMSRTQEGGASRSTYHGYAFTDHYNVDKRYGGNQAYKQLCEAAHAKGLKIIQDAVYNHVGNDHFFVRDMPMKDWLNQWPTYTNTSYKDQPLVDPYASKIDKEISVSGWFTPFLVDLNQRNQFVSTFLIQHAIWTTEEFGIDGWRVDTYFYSDPAFLNKINDALLKEFPKLTVFGEAWVNTVVNSAYFAQNNFSGIGFKHNVQGVTDFPLYFAMLDGLNQNFGWTEGVNRVYMTLVQDIAYKDPSRNCIFLDNHDLDRIYSVVGEDFNKFKMSINWLMTLRGIPQLYYGTEILMKNFKNPSDAEVRRDFPGGFQGDPSNKFTASGRTDQENEAFNFISKLAKFRKNSSAIGKGKLMQFVPQDGVYTYFRYDNNQTVMVISNTGNRDFDVKMKRFEERLNGFSKLKDIQTGQERRLDDFTIKPKESFVFEVLK